VVWDPTCALTAGPLFHKANSPALFHSIESVDKLISIEDRDEPVHCTRSVSWAGRNVFSEDAPGIFDGLQYVVLIRGVHSPHPLSADSIRSLNDSFLPMPLERVPTRLNRLGIPKSG
jgi:hypothetical protein